MARTVIDKRVFDGVKKALKSKANYKTISKYYEISSESIRKIKNAHSWVTWNINKQEHNRLVQAKKHKKPLFSRLFGFFNG